jgi:hypothetical protein
MHRLVLLKQGQRELKPYGFDKSTPLWDYALKEASSWLEAPPRARCRPDRRRSPDRPPSDGRELVSARSAELAADTAEPGSGFRMIDFLTYDGVDTTSRGQ